MCHGQHGHLRCCRRTRLWAETGRDGGTRVTRRRKWGRGAPQNDGAMRWRREESGCRPCRGRAAASERVRDCIVASLRSLPGENRGHAFAASASLSATHRDRVRGRRCGRCHRRNPDAAGRRCRGHRAVRRRGRSTPSWLRMAHVAAGSERTRKDVVAAAAVGIAGDRGHAVSESGKSRGRWASTCS